MKRIGWLFLLLAACSTSPMKQEDQGAERPVSQQPAETDAAARAKAHTELGMLYLQNRQAGVALEEARIAVTADPGYAGGHHLLGLVHMFLGEPQPARSAFQRAVGLAPNDPLINNDYGWFLCTQGEHREGIRRLSLAARNPLFSAPTRSFFNAGLCALQSRDEASAETYFRQSLLADPTNTPAAYQLSALLYKTGRHLEARRLIEEVMRQIEPTAESLWLALRIERKLGDRRAEAGYAAQLRRRFPDSEEFKALQQGRFE